MIKFYIIYSIDIPTNKWELYEDFSSKELYEKIFKYNLFTPYIFDIEDFLEEGDSEEMFYPWFDNHREHFIDILYKHEKEKIINNSLEENIPYYILYNKNLFEVSEEDNNSTEFDCCNTIHRKYVALLNPEQFLEFIEPFLGYYTCDTMGSLTELGLLPAFNIKIDSNNIEHCYISVLFDKQIPEEEMIEIEDNIREAIKDSDIEWIKEILNG